MESFAISLLQKELRGTFHSDLTQNEDSGFSVGLENDNWFLWRICFQGPVDTPFEGGIFVAMLRFPGDYPNNPPEMRFSTEMWHPNNGRVCISILHPPGTDEFNQQESADERWRPILGVESILLSVVSMLTDPNISSPANIEASVRNKQIQYKNDKVGYVRKVRRLAQNSVNFL